MQAINFIFLVKYYCNYVSIPAEVLILSVTLFVCSLHIHSSSFWKYRVLAFTVKEISKCWQNEGVDAVTSFSLTISFC